MIIDALKRTATAAAAILILLMASPAFGQFGLRSVYSPRSVTIAVATGDQLRITMEGTCNTTHPVQILLAADLSGNYVEGWGPLSGTVIGSPVSCNGSDAYTAAVTLHSRQIWQLDKLRLEAKGAWDLGGSAAVWVRSADDDLDGWLVPFETRIVW